MTKKDELIVYLNGEFVPDSEAKISIHDAGFLRGYAAFDISRTLGHKPYKVREHIDRLYRSLKYIQIDPGMTKDEMERITLEVVERNKHLLSENDDFWITQNVSKGVMPNLGDIFNTAGPTVVIYCQFIPFRSLAKGFLAGVKLLTTSTRRIPSQFLDARAKVRNYLNLILAELEARAAGPEFWPLVLDADGFVSENVGGNFFAVIDGKLYTPPTYKALAGIARATVMDYARKLRIPIEEKDMLLYDVINAEEAFLTSTSKMIMPVSHINGVKIGERVPGPITKCLADAWIKDTGVDFVRQAASHLTEEERKQLPEPWTDKID